MRSLIGPFKKISYFFLTNFIAGIICTFLFIENPLDSAFTFIIGTLWGMAIFTSQWLGHSYLQGKIAKHYSWIDKPVQRLILTIIAVVFYSVFAFIGIQIIMNYLVFGEIPAYLLSFNFANWLLPILISFFISILLAAIDFFKNLRKSIEEKEKLKTEMLSYKYEALRNQINPHFMFNSLNVLSDLVYDDQETAIKFIHQFSDIYRYVLDSRDKELVPLQDEVDFIEKFVFLLKIRFENKFQIEIDLPCHEGDLIVPLALQLLVENAVKHNEISTVHPLRIRIKRVGNAIEITNPIRIKNAEKDSKKIGLKNLNQQFSYFTDIQPIIKTENNQFYVKLPILKQN